MPYYSPVNLSRIIEKLQHAAPRLREQFGVTHIYIFGSQARGDARPDSDCDILVDFEPAFIVTLFTLGALHAELEAILSMRVDVGTIDTIRPAYRDSILAEARRVA